MHSLPRRLVLLRFSPRRGFYVTVLIGNILGERRQLVLRVSRGILLPRRGTAPRDVPERVLCEHQEHDGVRHVSGYVFPSLLMFVIFGFVGMYDIMFMH